MSPSDEPGVVLPSDAPGVDEPPPSPLVSSSMVLKEVAGTMFTSSRSDLLLQVLSVTVFGQWLSSLWSGTYYIIFLKKI